MFVLLHPNSRVKRKDLGYFSAIKYVRAYYRFQAICSLWSIRDITRVSPPKLNWRAKPIKYGVRVTYYVGIKRKHEENCCYWVGLCWLASCGIMRKKRYEVIGLERNTEVVERLKNGKSHIKDRFVERLLSEAHATGWFHQTVELSELSDCEAYLIYVPTPVDENLGPDLTPLLGAAKDVSHYLKKGSLVVVESTVFPGTCEDMVLPVLENGSGLTVGDDIHLAHCPERVNPGDAFWTSENIPRVGWCHDTTRRSSCG
jgi:UDP-N-acetyl-D-mannosaminuronate dehydrogenase